MNFRILVVSILVSLGLIGCLGKRQSDNLPIIAIANYGPHASLDDAITGLKNELAQQGFIEGKTIHYQVAHVNFDTSLIPQMVTQLCNVQPTVIVAMTTPIAQFIQHSGCNIPVVYNVITDPVAVGLIPDETHPSKIMTGSSDRQDMHAVLGFIKHILPQAHRIGLLYGIGESNDTALVAMMKNAVTHYQMELVAIPVSQTRDIQQAMEGLKNKVDCMYVGTSGTIQPSLPVIAQAADSFGIPIINVNEDAVKQGIVMASFGVNYQQVGRNAGKLVARILQGASVDSLPPVYPTLEDHYAYISEIRAQHAGAIIPMGMNNITVIRGNV